MEYNSILIYCFIIVFFTYYLNKYFISIAPKIGLVDIPNHRSSHKKATPRGAGIVIGIMFFFSMFFFKIELALQNIYPMIAFLIILICGIIDDLKEITSKTKFLFTIFASLFLVYDNHAIDYLGNYLGNDFYLGYLSIPFTIFAIVGFTNALNVIDGLDGLAAGVSSIILTTLLILGFVNGDEVLIIIPSFLLAILIGFLLLNWYPAKVFMGDSGSLLLGLIISFLTIRALEYVTPTAVLFLAALPILDIMVVFRRRLQRGKSPFKADKNHMHHILQNTKRNVKFTVTTLIMIQIAFCLIFLQVLDSIDILNIVLFIVLYLIFFNLFDPRSRRRHEKKKKKKSKERTTYIELLKREKNENQ